MVTVKKKKNCKCPLKFLVSQQQKFIWAQVGLVALVNCLVVGGKTRIQRTFIILPNHHPKVKKKLIILMESRGPLTATLREKSKQALLLWLDGVREACCLHRVVIYCLRSCSLSSFCFNFIDLLLLNFALFWFILLFWLKVKRGDDPYRPVFSLKWLYFSREVLAA